MGTLRYFLVPALLSICCHVAGAQRIYRDPGGLYTIPVPQGWTATPNGSALMLVSRDSYALVTMIAGGAAEPRRVADYTDQFGRQWQAYQRLQTGSASLGGVAGSYAFYSGKNPKGVDAVVKATSVPRGRDALVVLFSSPVQDWNRIKADMETMEGGFSLNGAGAQAPQRTAQAQPPRSAPPAPQRDPSGGVALPPGGIFGGGGTSPAPAPQNAPRPAATAPVTQGGRSVPQGFSVSARSGAIGQALTASFTGGASARAVFRGIYRSFQQYFDGPAQLRGAFGDAADRDVQAFFDARFQGAPVHGLMTVNVNAGKGYISVLFDRPELFNRSLPTLSRGMKASLPAGSGGGAGNGGGGGMAKPQPLQMTPLPDGSGQVGLPSGWRITGAYKGVVDIVGPAGQNASFGGYQVAYVNPMPGTPATMMTGPYRPPAPALQLYLDVLTQRAISRGSASFRVIEQAPVQAQQGQQSAYITYQLTGGGKTALGFALVTTAPIDNTSWFYYMSVIAAPSERFAADFPTMWNMWKSWSVNPAVFRERMDAALQSMRETYKIIQSVHDNQQRTYDNVNTAWDQVIRGVTTIEDIVTKERADVDTNNVQYIVRRMNEEGYQVREVPLPELVQ